MPQFINGLTGWPNFAALRLCPGLDRAISALAARPLRVQLEALGRCARTVDPMGAALSIKLFRVSSITVT
jgi:hypothetical protein